MSTFDARSASQSRLTVPVVLGIILVPPVQLVLGYFGGHGGSVLLWVVGTPIAYFVIGALGAFATVSDPNPAEARRRGSFVGLMTGIAGACSSAAILAAIAAWNILAPSQPQSSLHLYAGYTSGMPRLFSFAMTMPGSPHAWLVLILIFFVPLFLGVNLLGSGLAPLGGMLGGYLRARFAQRGQLAQEQPDEQRPLRSGRGVVAATATILAIVGIVTVAAAIFWTIGGFAAVVR
ncbi:MAG: hypothetical protein ACM3N4_01720 [Nitrososphaerota archaeon]